MSTLASLQRQQLTTIEEIVRDAGAVLMSYYRGDYTVELKGEADPVTEADHASSRLIVSRLNAAFPSDGVLSEESIDTDALVGKHRVWMVDPMDGTKEFINYTDEFAAMIGLCVDGRPTMGVVYQPATDTLYRGVVGEGAEVVRRGSISAADGATEVSPLAVSGTSELSALKLIVSRSHTPETVRRMADEVGITQMVKSGSVGLKIGRISTRDCDLYLHPSRGTKLWDACAPEAILAAAGGRMTDFDGSPIRYDATDANALENMRGLLATNSVVHDDLLRHASKYF